MVTKLCLPIKCLKRQDILIGKNVLLVRFLWSKANQFAKRVHSVPLLAINGSPLCPVSAYKRMCVMAKAGNNSPAFVLPKGSGVIPVTIVNSKNVLEFLL